MKNQVQEKIESMSVYALADNNGFIYVQRSETVAASLAMDLLNAMLDRLQSNPLTNEQCAAPLFPMTFATQDVIRENVATLLDVSPQAVKHRDVNTLVLKLANLVWATHAGDIHYPGAHPDPASRLAFKQALITRLTALPRTLSHTLSFIANLLDRHCTRSTQKQLIDSLATFNAIETLLAAQPSLNDCIQQELSAAFPALPPTFTLHNLESVWFFDPSDPSLPQQTLASLIKQSLSGPHQADALNQNLHLRYAVNDPTALYAQITISAGQYHQFTGQLKQLAQVYTQALKTFWASPAHGNDEAAPSKEQSWVQQLKLQLETEIRLLSVDGTLPPKSAELLRQVISNPVAANREATGTLTPAKVVRVGIQNDRSKEPRRLSSVMAFMTESSGPESMTAILYSPANGLEVFETTRALKEEMNRRFNQRTDLNDWLTYVPDDHYAETAFFSNDVRKRCRTKGIDIDVFMESVADQLQKHYSDVQYVFEHATTLGLYTLPGALSQRLDEATRRSIKAPASQRLAARARKLITRMTPEEVARAFYIQQHPDQALPLNTALPITDVSAVFHAPARLKTLTKDSEFRALAVEMFASEAAQSVLKTVLEELIEFIPAHLKVTTETALRLTHKYISHNRTAPDVDSHQYSAFFAIQHALRNYRYFSSDYHYLTSSLLTLGANPTASEQPELVITHDDFHKARQISAVLSPVLHRLIGGTALSPDMFALAGYLNINLLFADPSIADAGLKDASINIRLALMMDSTEFHQLEKALLSASPWTVEEQKKASPGQIKALAVSVITDYLLAPANHRQGYVGGFNLNTPLRGDSPVHQVREQAMEHLSRSLKCTSRQERDLAFGILAQRYCPELLIFDAPQDLRYGNSKRAMDFRHAVALAEITLPGAAPRLGYQPLMALLESTLSQTLTPDQELAVSVLRKIPVLHFAMCRQIIPFTDIGDVSHEDALKAFTYTTEREEEYAKTLTVLLQDPPDRKKMARKQLAAQHPDIAIHKKRRFTDSEINQYFVSRFKSRGRNMSLSLLEMYMTCGHDRSFDDQTLGFDSKGLAGCTLNSAFNTAYDNFEARYNKALVARLVYAINDLPVAQRHQLLNTDHFLKLSFDIEGTSVPGYFGLLAISNAPSAAFSLADVYEVFCPSGTIKKLAHEGEVISHYATWDASGLFRSDHYIKGLPAFDTHAYTRATPGSDRSRASLDFSFSWSNPVDVPEALRVEQLSQLMVDHWFSQAMKILRPQYAHPTPYEEYRDALVAKTQTIFKIFIPFYALYRDIEEDDVTVGTVLTTLLEAWTFILPFAKAVYSGYKASILLGNIVVRSTTFGASKAAVLAMRTAYASRAFTVSLAKGWTSAANPFALVGLLFRGAIKGFAYLQRTHFLRQKLKHVTPLTQLQTRMDPQSASKVAVPEASIEPKKFGTAHTPLNLFQPDFSWGNRKLDIRQQQLFHQPDVDLSTATLRNNIYTVGDKNYIKMQNNIFAIHQPPNTRAFHLHTADIQGPAVRFNTKAQHWELDIAGLTGGAPPRPTRLTRQISLPMDDVLGEAGTYMAKIGNYVEFIGYDTQLGTWRQLIGTELGSPVWRDSKGQWQKGSIDQFNANKSLTPTPTRLKTFDFPALPQVPENALAIPNHIHYIWIGTQAPPLHLINNMATNINRSTEFISTLHLDVSDELFNTIKSLCREKVPQLVVSKLSNEPFFDTFLKSQNAEQYSAIKNAPHKMYAAACDVIRFPLTHYYGGLYLDLDDVLKVALKSADLKAAANDLLLGSLVKKEDIDFYGYNSSHYASQPNNPVLSAISTEMHKRYLANKDYYLQPRPVVDEQLPPVALAQARERHKAYYKEYFRLTGPTLLNDVLLMERPDCYNTVFQVVKGQTVLETSSIADMPYAQSLQAAFDHYFPFAHKFEIDTGSEHSWQIP